MALGVTSYWWGSSVSAGYRPTALGPRPISGPPEWPSSWVGGGWQPAFRGAVGDAKGAPGWGTPFDNPHAQHWQDVHSVQAQPVPGYSGLGTINAVRQWDHVFQPTVDPSFVWQRQGDGTVRYNNAPFFQRTMQPVHRPWPVEPNRGTFAGPYGSHALPFYARLMQSRPGVVTGWPYMRANRLGIAAQFAANMSRYGLPSKVYVHAHRAYATPGVRPRPDTAWPGAQAWQSRGRWDYFQQAPPGEGVVRARLL